MEASDPATPNSTNDETSRRKSGRVKQKPQVYQEDLDLSQANGSYSGKRKRSTLRGGSADDALDDKSEESNEEASDGDPDEEELRERRRRPRNKKPLTKPAPKKPRTAGASSTTLPVRPAVNGVKKPSKPKRAQASRIVGAEAEDDGHGLYCKLHTDMAEVWKLTRVSSTSLRPRALSRWSFS